MHHRENTKTCTIYPLREREDIHILWWSAQWSNQNEAPKAPENGILLSVNAPLLSRQDAGKPLVLIDATWKHAERMSNDYQHLEKRGLPPFQTAYPRISQLYDDPSSGLATIEALYIAYRILGYNCDGLLEHYHWSNNFLNINKDLFAQI